jgi:hypothetical protein
MDRVERTYNALEYPATHEQLIAARDEVANLIDATHEYLRTTDAASCRWMAKALARCTGGDK